NLQAELAWLYSQLLQPVEHEPDLQNKTQVYVVPFGNLNYLPFAALVRSTGPKPEYAVEHFNFGYMPSLYLLDLAMRAKQTEMTNSLILADPDGSLLGADTEATAVQHCLGSASHCCIGTNASFEALCDFAPESKIIHFATHSYFNRPTPEGSW